MTRRRLLCEGPEDLAAVRELAVHVFGGSVVRNAITGAGNPRLIELRGRSGVSIGLVASNGKSELPRSAATELAVLPDQTGPGEDRLKAIGVLFDPDDAGEEAFHDALKERLTSAAPDWAIKSQSSASWSARRRRGEHVFIKAIAWRGDAPNLAGLPDAQCLERLLCSVLRRAHPARESLAENLLSLISKETGAPPTWKSLVHLWCAVIAAKVTESSAPVRFLGQDETCRPHVKPALEANHLDQRSLMKDLFPFLR